MEVSYSYTEFEYPNLERVLNGMGSRMIEYMRDKLGDGINATGKLSQSLACLVQQDGQAWEVSISLEDYWKYVEYGTKPHWVPIQAIRSWVVAKPVIPTERNGKLPTVEELSHMIKWKIHEEGTEKHEFFWSSVEEAVADFEAAVEEALGQDVDMNIEALLLPLKF